MQRFRAERGYSQYLNTILEGFPLQSVHQLCRTLTTKETALSCNFKALFKNCKNMYSINLHSIFFINFYVHSNATILCRQKRGGKCSRPRLEMQLSEQLHTQSINFSSNELEATTQEGTVQSVKQPCWELFK